MGYTEPRLKVECDKCGTKEEFELTDLAGGGWDARDVDYELEEMGWLGEWDGTLHCDDCAKELGLKPDDEDDDASGG